MKCSHVNKFVFIENLPLEERIECKFSSFYIVIDFGHSKQGYIHDNFF